MVAALKGKVELRFIASCCGLLFAINPPKFVGQFATLFWSCTSCSIYNCLVSEFLSSPGLRPQIRQGLLQSRSIQGFARECVSHSVASFGNFLAACPEVVSTKINRSPKSRSPMSHAIAHSRAVTHAAAHS